MRDRNDAEIVLEKMGISVSRNDVSFSKILQSDLLDSSISRSNREHENTKTTRKKRKRVNSSL